VKHIKKRCSNCKKDKTLPSFYNAKDKKDGKMYICKSCCDKRVKLWIKNNPERAKENQKVRNAIHNPLNNPLNNPINNPKRMYVNGKYISVSHPLYKPGSYKTFKDAAFSSLAKYNSTKDGYVYIIYNPAWNNWIKVGMAIDAEDRCYGFQTSSPYRDYKLYHKRFFKDRRTAEQTAHDIISKISTERNGEWFKINKNDAKGVINAI
tara:strand:- start:207 stop:827 length:621 start_codon:yes stop_codon:yes gene_type:complete